MLSTSLPSDCSMAVTAATLKTPVQCKEGNNTPMDKSSPTPSIAAQLFTAADNLKTEIATLKEQFSVLRSHALELRKLAVSIADQLAAAEVK